MQDVSQALVMAPTSRVLAEHLEMEERKLAEMERLLEEAGDWQPTPIPHPGVIANFVTAMTQEMESGDAPIVGALLRSVLAPFRMVAQGAGYTLIGAIDLGRAAESTTEVSSGGVI